LGSIGLAMAMNIQVDENKIFDLTSSKLRAFWQGGISPGDWLELGRKTGGHLKNAQQNSAAMYFANLWFKGKGSKSSEFNKLVQELVALKNDFKHDRGPQGYEYERAIKNLDEKLNTVFRGILFSVQYPMRLIQGIDNDWKSKETVLDTLVYAGDHPGLRQERIKTNSTISKGKLYLDLSYDLLVPLYPLISVHYCTSCKLRETYMID
jgi:hypothetical protein